MPETKVRTPKSDGPLQHLDYGLDFVENQAVGSQTRFVGSGPDEIDQAKLNAKVVQHIDLASLHLSKGLALLPVDDQEREAMTRHLEGIGAIRERLQGDTLESVSAPSGYRRERKTALSKQKQEAALEWICGVFIERGSFTPVPIKEIAEHFQKSPEGMRCLLNDLVFEGKLILNPNKVIGGYFPSPGSVHMVREKTFKSG